jgi:hypothetical protein
MRIYDQGYNALEPWKEVVLRDGTAIHEHYKLTEKTINAIADVDYLVNELSF